jgi:transposase
MDVQWTTCPECGGTATLLQIREDFEEIPDLSRPTEKVRVPVKVEEFRCQEQSCEHEFEKVIREPS